MSHFLLKLLIRSPPPHRPRIQTAYVATADKKKHHRRWTWRAPITNTFRGNGVMPPMIAKSTHHDRAIASCCLSNWDFLTRPPCGGLINKLRRRGIVGLLSAELSLWGRTIRRFKPRALRALGPASCLTCVSRVMRNFLKRRVHGELSG